MEVIKVFTITKSKGKKFITDDPAKALRAYMSKWAIGMYFNGRIVYGKGVKNSAYTQAQVWDYIERYNNLNSTR